MVAHNLISQLAAIVGRCDLLNEGTIPSDGSSAKHIAVIRDIADRAIKELTEHQRQVDAEARRTDRPKAS
jgi:hypothetical protein